ncbi:Electron transfer flavoprotein, alpha subunit [Moorella glycerini]|uniref:Acryloyl-CoA reductase electron transfer subunit beta n=1 Tax=Neomoorella stamsii TaxID=1266720 RepID=A0A9X7J6T6_9FIRM|nr:MULTISPECIES: electron transfer flavoprotein subunit alpha/FixB family protein [Moorella]PRR77602.1 Acryloyl-CoA reductase electron transfer subunit beta [Moorella stamsii]CEP68515.1 Electron transfer flavoprotein, alpha subunit [Moorella glycerini]
MSNNVLVFIEGEEGHISEDSKNVLKEGRRLADEMGGTLVGTTHLGSTLKDELNNTGLDECWELPLEMTDDPCGQLAGLALAELAKDIQARLILAAHTMLGESVLATAAASLGGAFFSSCREISIKDANFYIHRITCGGKVDEIRTLVSSVCLGTIIPSGTGRKRFTGNKSVEFREMLTLIKGAVPEITGEFKAHPDEIDLTEAEFIVAIGGGVIDRKGYDMAARFASLIGATLGGSRIAVDRGFLPNSRLIGLTGHEVAPKIYIGIGISGAPHHLNGIRDARVIIGINKDPNAPLLKAADIAVVGDAYTILPALIEELGGEL